MKVFLIQQKRLEELRRDQKVLMVSIQRIEMKKWMPLFEVMGDDGIVVTCSLRTQSKEQVRTWADLRLLAEWLRVELAFKRCQLILDNLSVPTIGAEDGKNEPDTPGKKVDG